MNKYFFVRKKNVNFPFHHHPPSPGKKGKANSLTPTFLSFLNFHKEPLLFPKLMLLFPFSLSFSFKMPRPSLSFTPYISLNTDPCQVTNKTSTVPVANEDVLTKLMQQNFL